LQLCLKKQGRKCIRTEDNVYFTDNLKHLHERGFSYEGKNFFVKALELCNASTTTNESDELLSDIHYTLGAIANEINDGKSCLEHNIVLFDMCKKAAARAGKPDVRYAAAHSQLGVAYTMTGKLERATELFSQSVAMFRSLDNFMVDMMAFPMANYGLGLWLQGQLAEAEKAFVAALKEREEEFGKMDTVSYK
jgi:tetratricopeptide (TPR) repeat protein